MEENLIDISIIIPCKNEGTNLKSTVDSIINSINSLTFEIIVVDDASMDSSTDFLKSPLSKDIYNNINLIEVEDLGCAGARNAGAKVSKGKYLFFCDAHIKVEDMWLDYLVRTSQNYNADLVVPCICDMINTSAAAYGATWNNRLEFTWLINRTNNVTEVPLAGAAALCITKEAFNKINGFDNFLQRYGSEDQELCLKAWLYGYKLVINPYVKVRHLFRTKHPYKVTYDNVIYNTLCLAYSHFSTKRLSKTIEMLKINSAFSVAASNIKLNMDAILKQREKYFTERIYDDNFFFKKFNIYF